MPLSFSKYSGSNLAMMLYALFSAPSDAFSKASLAWFAIYDAPLILPRILTDNDIDERGTILLRRALERRFNGVGPFDALAEDAERFREPGEVDIRAGNLGTHFCGDSDSLLRDAKLILHCHVGAVVENDHDQR